MGESVILRAKRITKEQENKVIELRGKMKAQDIADLVGVTYNQVHEVFKRNDLTDKQNIIFNLTELQEQILLSGKLGDGNYKPNGKNNYYYRESHAEDELEYLTWKMNTLGENIIASGGLYQIKKGGWNVQQLYGFSTKTSPTLIKYANMSISDTIKLLNQYGLIMYLLDDGWFSNHSKAGNFCLSGGMLNEDELMLLCEQFEKFGFMDVHIVGNKKRDIVIPNINNNLIFNITTEIIPVETDIISKKFNKFIN